MSKIKNIDLIWENKFYTSLKRIFIGTKIEGISGFINLMRIKSIYFKKFIKDLKKNIDSKLEEFPEFREELYESLYTFFKNYFSESGAIYFTKTPFFNNIYAKVFIDNEDVSLFYKTNMLYYVKTDRRFKKMNFELKGKTFEFDVSGLVYKKANEKRNIIYKLKEVKNVNHLIFSVTYSEQGKTTNYKEILKSAKNKEDDINLDLLNQAFNLFEIQSKVDYFINKNAREYLVEQFDLWLYRYVYITESNFSESRINQLKAMQEVAYHIIEFISQFEDELVKIWQKPKFVLNSNYVITLNKIAEISNGIEIVRKMVNSPDLSNQIIEWKELNIIKDFDRNDILTTTIQGKSINPKYLYLPLDTKYFPGLKEEILNCFENLDDALDGWLIKSENWQALNTIMPKFKNKIQTIYIDPPFNKENEADYFYNVKFKDSTWISLLENRLNLAKDLLKSEGSIFVRCDYNGNMYMRLLMNEIFGATNFRNELIISRISKQDPKVRKYNVATDSLLFYTKSDDYYFDLQFKKLDNPKPARWHSMDSDGQGKPQKIFGYSFPPPKNRHWTYSEEKCKILENDNKIRIRCKKCKYVHLTGTWKSCPECGNKDEVRVDYLLPPTDQIQVNSNWSDVSGYTSNWDFPTENSEILLERAIHSSSNKNDLVMDFFLGSGTTISVAHKLGRKWIGIEMGDHFYSVVLPRMKKVLAGDKLGASRTTNWKGGGFFKYYELEQYDDTLKKVKYEGIDSLLITESNYFQHYIFLRDPKLTDSLKIDYEKNKVIIDFTLLYDNIDLAETLSNIMGFWIKQINEEYVIFKTENDEKVEFDGIDYRIIKPLIWWD